LAAAGTGSAGGGGDPVGMDGPATTSKSNIGDLRVMEAAPLSADVRMN
jgi:hypothetical protein